MTWSSHHTIIMPSFANTTNLIVRAKARAGKARAKLSLRKLVGLKPKESKCPVCEKTFNGNVCANCGSQSNTYADLRSIQNPKRPTESNPPRRKPPPPPRRPTPLPSPESEEPTQAWSPLDK